MSRARRNKVQDNARLHEQAVQKIARGEIMPIRRRGADRAQGRTKRCETLRVRPEVWEQVRKICSDSARIEIISETEVIIWSSPAQAARMKEKRAKAA